MDERVMIYESVFFEIGEKSTLHIGDSVETFPVSGEEMEDFEEYRVNTVYIGKGLQRLEGGLPFGDQVQDILVDEENPYYASIDGVLFSKDGKRLVLYPAGRENSYEIPVGTESIEAFAFYMVSFPEKIFIPDTVKVVNNKAFIELEDKGLGSAKEDIMCMTTIYCPEALKEQIGAIWNEKTYQKPAVIYYGENCKVLYDGKEYADVKEVCEAYGLQPGKVCFYVEQYQIAVEKAVEYCLEEKNGFVFKSEDGCYEFRSIAHIADLLGESVKEIRNCVIEENISMARFLERVINGADKEVLMSDIRRIGKAVESTEYENANVIEIK